VQPAAGYALLGDQQIAYQVMGDGPIDLLITAGFWGSFDVEWEDPMIRLFYQRLAEFARVIRFDRRGTGSSDPVPLDALPPWEAFVEEIVCVLDAVGSEQAALLMISDAGPAGMLFAATRSEKCRALVLFNSTARFLSADDYPIGMSPQVYQDEVLPTVQRQEGWGTGAEGTARWFFPSRAGDPGFLRWLAKLQRSIASPAAAEQYAYATVTADGRSLLSSIHVPTLVLHRIAQPALSIAHGRYLAEHIQGSRFVELPGADSMPYWEHPELTLTALEGFLTEEQRHVNSQRALAAIVFTDIVDSTKHAERVGDRQWRALLDLHDESAHAVLENYGGRLVKSTGDGILCILDGPGRAIRAAQDLKRELTRIDLEIRSGIHTGEIEIRGDDVGGIAVHIAARVMAAAGPGDLLVSSTVKDLVVGSGIVFEDRGRHVLKGVEGEWQLFAVVP
jgi:class 3 adenylate cyclase